MDFELNNRDKELKKQMREFTEKEILPKVSDYESGKISLRDLTDSMGWAGIFRLVVPQKYGGYDEQVSCMALCLAREELAKGYYFAAATIATQGLGAVPISVLGSEAQKKEYLPELASGELKISFCLTEEEAGSDVSNIQTTAVRVGDEYVINGTKRFASNAGLSDACVVFAKTDPDQGIKGLSAFLVDVKNPGVKLKRNLPILCKDVLGEYSFNDCRVSKSNLLGEEGQGFLVAMKTLDVMRPTVGGHVIGLAQAALDAALEYSQRRTQFGTPLADMQATQMKLAEMAAELSAARLLVYQAAIAKDTGDEKLTLKSSIAKLYATEAAQRIVDQALQIHGGNGVLAGDFPLERYYREVRAPRIYEGTSEIQKIVIARRLLKGQSIDFDL